MFTNGLRYKSSSSNKVSEKSAAILHAGQYPGQPEVRMSGQPKAASEINSPAAFWLNANRGFNKLPARL
jgi:hypothetical protein